MTANDHKLQLKPMRKTRKPTTASISLTYYPQQDRNVGGLFSGWAINQIYNIGWNQLKDFTPDLGAYMNRRAKKKHKTTEVKDSRSPIAPSN